MGTMPFHLEKGVLGLRLDYLTRSEMVRTEVVRRLDNDESPFAVATSIEIAGVGLINVLNDSRAQFMAKLDLLKTIDPGDHHHPDDDKYERRSGAEYFNDQSKHLAPANNDNPGNRAAFAGYWLPREPIIREQLREVLQVALNSGKGHIDYWWECSLELGDDPQVLLLETPGAAHVFFVTDHGPVEPDTTGVRGTPEPDPDPLPPAD